MLKLNTGATFLFAWRYFKAKKSTNAINIIAWISILAMTFGTTALILVLSVFNGFEGMVKSLYSDFYTDLKIFPAQGKVLTLTPEQIKMIRGATGIKNVSLIAEEKDCFNIQVLIVILQNIIFNLEFSLCLALFQSKKIYQRN